MAHNNNDSENGGGAVIEIKNVSRSYGVVRALRDVSFSVRRGSVHTILGENGAGKSTLMKILGGEETPEAGEILVNGAPVREYSPQHAHSLGIQMVHQELAAFENLTVAENIYPWHRFRTGAGAVDWNTLNQKAEEILRLFDIATISPTQKMGDVPLAGQQIIEILRCIAAEPGIIILDEPTSGLNNQEADRLMHILRDLRAKGYTILYISHRLKEVLEISDRVTVLRDGEYITTLENEGLHEDALVDHMVGRSLSGTLYRKKEYKEIDKNRVVAEVRGFAKEGVLLPSGFTLREREVLGVFGLEGSGADRFSRMLYGLEARDAGEFVFKGKTLDSVTPGAMVANRIMYLNNNRKAGGLFLEMSTRDNIAAPVLKKMSRFGFLAFGRLLALTEEFIKKFSIALRDARSKPRSLSGGNQQKVMLSMCLAAEPELLIVNEPTRGVDVGAKAEIHRFLLELSESGAGLIIFSSELPELISLCDRILVMQNMRISGSVRGGEISEVNIMRRAASMRHIAAGSENAEA